MARFQTRMMTKGLRLHSKKAVMEREQKVRLTASKIFSKHKTRYEKNTTSHRPHDVRRFGFAKKRRLSVFSDRGKISH